MNNPDILMASPLFAGISRDEIHSLLSCFHAAPLSFARGDTILAEGDPADRLGIVLCGSVQVIRVDYYGNRSIMGKLGAGDLFAEAFACAGVAAMPVHVLALEDTQVLMIRADNLMHPCAAPCSFHHQLIYNLMRILATKNLICQQKIDVTSRRSTREKLMAYLMLEAKKADSSSFLIPYDRQELADYLEVDRSGLSAEISKLRREGVLACERSRFTLLNADHE